MPPENRETRVNVVMITHNRAGEVLHSLEQLAKLPERPSIILVDNGSTDGTVSAVKRQFPQVDVVPLSRNVGAAARTVGVRKADAPYVAFCDDDTWWAQGSLSRAADVLDAHPRLAVLTARILVGPEQREDPACRELEQSPLPPVPGMPGPALLGFLAGASVVRRAAFLQCGGFEPRLFIGGEEGLLAIDLATRGWELCYLPELTVHHHPSNVRNAGHRRWTTIRNDLWVTWLRRPLASALRRTLQITRSNPLDSITIKSYSAALGGAFWVLRNRRVVPPELEKGLRRLEASSEETRERLFASDSSGREPVAGRKAPVLE